MIAIIRTITSLCDLVQRNYWKQSAQVPFKKRLEIRQELLIIPERIDAFADEGDVRGHGRDAIAGGIAVDDAEGAGLGGRRGGLFLVEIVLKVRPTWVPVAVADLLIASGAAVGCPRREQGKEHRRRQRRDPQRLSTHDHPSPVEPR